MSTILEKSLSDNLSHAPESILKFTESGDTGPNNNYYMTHLFGDGVTSHLQASGEWTEVVNSGASVSQESGYVRFTGGSGGGYENASSWNDSSINTVFVKFRPEAFNPNGSVIWKTGGSTHGMYIMIDTSNNFRFVINNDSVTDVDFTFNMTPVLNEDFIFGISGGNCWVGNMTHGTFENYTGAGSSNYNFSGTAEEMFGIGDANIVGLGTIADIGLIGRFYYAGLYEDGPAKSTSRLTTAPYEQQVMTTNGTTEFYAANVDTSTGADATIPVFPRDMWDGNAVVRSELIYHCFHERTTPLTLPDYDICGFAFECKSPMRYLNGNTIAVSFKTRVFGESATFCIQVWDFDQLVETKKLTTYADDIVVGVTFDLPTTYRARSYSERVLQGEDNMWVAIGVEAGISHFADPIVSIDEQTTRTDYF